MEPKIPTVFAVTAWVASGLAVMAYTFLSFKETANGLESGAIAAEQVLDPLVANAAVLAAEQVKPLERGKFKSSGN